MKARIIGDAATYDAEYHYTTIRLPLTKEIIRFRTLEEIIVNHNASAAKRTDLSKLPKNWDEETEERRASMTREDSPLWKEVVGRIPYDGVYENKTNPMVYIKTKNWCRLLPLSHVEIVEE